MEAILTAVIPVVIIGVICAAVLVIASKVMRAPSCRTKLSPVAAFFRHMPVST